MDNDLIERLRKLRDCAEETDDAEIVDDDPRCVFVPMLPEDFDALLREAADALEAARADAARYRWLRGLDGACDSAACVNFNIGFDWIEQHGDELDAAIDAAMAAEGRE